MQACRISDLGLHPCRSAQAMASADACTSVADYTFGAPSGSAGANLCVAQSTCKPGESRGRGRCCQVSGQLTLAL